MQPILQISTGVEYLLAPNKISGALYHNVTTSCVRVLVGIWKARAKPCIFLVNNCINTTSTYKVSQFDVSIVTYENILWFQITMNDSLRVAEGNSLQNLIHGRFDILWRDWYFEALSVVVHLLFQIVFNKVKYEV